MDNFPYYGSYKGQKNDPVPLDSVGGTVLWVDANLHREGVIFPPFYLIGSEWDRNGYAYSYNHAHRLRLEKLLYLETSRNPNGV